MEQKVLNLKILYAWVHLLNEGGLNGLKKTLLTSCSFITSRANTDAVLKPRVINKVQIGPQFEYIILQCFQHTFSTARITRSNSSKVNKFNKQQRLIQVTAAERTRERDEAAQIARLMSEWEFTERGTCGS